MSTNLSSAQHNLFILKLLTTINIRERGKKINCCSPKLSASTRVLRIVQREYYKKNEKCYNNFWIYYFIFFSKVIISLIAVNSSLTALHGPHWINYLFFPPFYFVFFLLSCTIIASFRFFHAHYKNLPALTQFLPGCKNTESAQKKEIIATLFNVEKIVSKMKNLCEETTKKNKIRYTTW